MNIISDHNMAAFIFITMVLVTPCISHIDVISDNILYSIDWLPSDQQLFTVSIKTRKKINMITSGKI